MVETYCVENEKLFWKSEPVFGFPPETPYSMFQQVCSSIELNVDANNIVVHGSGFIDPIAIKRGLLQPSLRAKFPLAAANPVGLIQNNVQELNQSLRLALCFFHGDFEAPSDLVFWDFAGARFNKAVLSCDVTDGGIVFCDADFVAQNLMISNSKPQNVSFMDTMDVPAVCRFVKVNGNPCERVTGWKVAIDNSCRAVQVIRSDEAFLAKYIPWGKRVLSGELTLEFESKSEAASVLLDTELSSLRFDLGQNQAGDDCFVELEHVKFDKFSLSGSDLIFAHVPFSARNLTIDKED